MTSTRQAEFDQRYPTHVKYLKHNGLQPKTIEAGSRAMRCMGKYFDLHIDELSSAHLTDQFSESLATHAWSSGKLDLYGYKFCTQHVLGKPWGMPHLVKAPKAQRLPDIVTVDEAAGLFAATRGVSQQEEIQNTCLTPREVLAGLGRTRRQLDWSMPTRD